MSGVRALGLFAACAALFVWLAIEHPLGTRLVVVAVFGAALIVAGLGWVWRACGPTTPDVEQMRKGQR